MNILFTCAGRRNYLLRYFRGALPKSSQIVAVDAAADAPALQEADAAIVVPRVESPEYVESLVAVCLEYRIGLLISLNDHELPVLAENATRFLEVGTKLLVSEPHVIELCFDKLATLSFAKEIGLKVPQCWTALDDVRRDIRVGKARFPLYVKPRWGTASSGIEQVWDEDELHHAWFLGLRRLNRLGLRSGDAALLAQDALPGVEYGLDVINDFQGQYQATFVKRKLAMRAGETDKAVTEDRPDLVAVGERIGRALGHFGNLDCDLFVDGDAVYLLEFNPRFGGGYPFSAEAGADVPGALVAWLQGVDPPAGWDNIRYGVQSGKCDRVVSVRRDIASMSRVIGSRLKMSAEDV